VAASAAQSANHRRRVAGPKPLPADNSKKRILEICGYLFLGPVVLVLPKWLMSCKRLWLATESAGLVWRPGRLLVVSWRAIVAGS
jgi:hypothetical protein